MRPKRCTVLRCARCAIGFQVRRRRRREEGHQILGPQPFGGQGALDIGRFLAVDAGENVVVIVFFQFFQEGHFYRPFA